MTRKKPVGEDFIAWCQEWDRAGHDGKLALAEKTGISYDTARHWRSDVRGIPKPEKLPTAREPGLPELKVEDLPNPAVNLDFACFDLETSNLKADFSIVLSAVIKPFGKDPVVFRADDYPAWVLDRVDDKEIVSDIAFELARHAIVVTHYGSKFDLPYLRAKMTHHRLPVLPPMFAMDTLKVARANFCVSSRRLGALGRYFELGDKHEVEGGLWMDAAYTGGERATKAMDSVVEHNIQDVILLERLACLAFPYMKSVPRM